ncbi:iron-containing alcohol dehydrogenase [Haloferula chungangensis]|uniref:Iron-containing alcohol dehydrogenase n=1 Tax=Haloferula chungangensis TaxID=1048331 RepID=A0ABW2LDP4_9BACT
MTSFDARPSPRILFGPGRLAELPDAAKSLGATNILLVTDSGIVAAGHIRHATGLLRDAGLKVTTYQDTHINPGETDIEACRAFAEPLAPDLIIGFGGGSSMDTAKGCNFLLNNGGRMSDYHGYGHAEKPLLPFIAIPTTAGTGSECQSYAVVSREDSHEKMACGDPKALAKIAILDPELTLSQPQKVATLTALDALSHALESAVCTKRNPISSAYSRESFRLIASSISSILKPDAPIGQRSKMLLGAAMAGSAIENSMLGAAHATANPLTAFFDVPHGHAVALTLPHVIRFNSVDPESAAIYDDFSSYLGEPLIDWLENIIASAHLPRLDIDITRIPELTAAALPQWTGKFNPRPINGPEVTAIYTAALTVT